MPRNLKGLKAPGARADGVLTAGNVADPTAGQPNGIPVDAGLPRGEATALRTQSAMLPMGAPAEAPPPGVTPGAHSVAQALMANPPNVTPLSAPTENPLEAVMAGSHGSTGVGPPHPMADPMLGAAPSVQGIIQQAADASGSPTLQRLAAASAAAGQ
jgi:hypothetical protein